MSETATAGGKTFPHGVHPPEHKEATASKASETLPLPPEVVVPLSQHIGAPARAIVEKKQTVARGEPIAAPGGFVSVPMHAPVAGTVTKIDKALLANGTVATAIYIKTAEDADRETAHGEPQDVATLIRSEMVSAVQAAGLVGLGGAAFPTHVKMQVPEGKTVDVVLANGCECEPYLTTDHRLMLERIDDLFEGMRLAIRATGADRGIIGVEVNKPDAIAALRGAVPKDLPVTVEAVQTKYPQGAEKMLIKALTKREAPSGGLPADVGVAVFNVATLAQLGYLLPRGQGLIERVVTVTGPGVEKPGNYLVALGTPLRFVLEHAGFSGRARQVILGGPMMGMSAGSLDVPITKGTSGVLVLTEDQLEQRRNRKVYPCIRCGLCLQACPAYLNPSRMGLLARNGAYETLADEFHLNDCFECGSCTYTCPSNIPLVHYFRVAKMKLRERKRAK